MINFCYGLLVGITVTLLVVGVGGYVIHQFLDYLREWEKYEEEEGGYLHRKR